jgi:hypothetical protein
MGVSDEPPLKKLARDRLDYHKNPHESINKENHQSNREVILLGNSNASADDISDGASSSHVSTTNAGSLVKTVFNSNATDSSGENSTAKSQNLSSNFNAQLSLKTDTNAAAAALAAKKSNYEKFTATRLLQDENQKKTLLLKMEVQQKARELIEKQIKDQKLLLHKFEQAKTVEEKSLILSLVKKLSESIEREKDILSNNKKVTSLTPHHNKVILAQAATSPSQQPPPSSTTATSGSGDATSTEKAVDNSGSSSPSLFSNASPFSFQKNVKAHPHALSIPPAPHHLKLNNKRLNNTNFLKHGAPLNASSFAANAQSAAASTAASASTSFSFSRVSVDNRPKSLLVTCLESNGQEKNQIVNFINSLGCQIENVFDYQQEENNGGANEEPPMAASTSKSFIICFLTRKDAEVVRINIFFLISFLAVVV